MARLFSRSTMPAKAVGQIGNNTGVLVMGNVQGDVVQISSRAREPVIGFRSAIGSQSVFAPLDWRARLTDVVGRETEMEDLLAWAHAGDTVRARLVWGEGGVGKTRLAAEFAERLRNTGWTAGFADLTEPDAYHVGPAGLLLIVDYPEERRSDLRPMLRGLNSLAESDVPIRVLLLSRREWEFWQEDVERSHATTAFDAISLRPRELSAGEAYTVYAQAIARLADGEPPTHRSTADEFNAWYERTPRSHRPLYVLAAAQYAVTFPDASPFAHSDADVFGRLARRELAHLKSESEAHDLAPDALGRLAALAALRGPLGEVELRDCAKPELELGLPAPTEVVDRIRPTSLVRSGCVEPPRPDLLAAALAHEVLSARGGDGGLASEWLWWAVSDPIDEACARLSRLHYDARIVLGLPMPIASELARAVDSNVDRCRRLEPAVVEVVLPLALREAAVTVYRTLADATDDEVERARLLVNLASDLAESGDPAAALPITQEAVEIQRRLAKVAPERFLPDLALSLNNLASDLAENGMHAAALPIAQEAVDIRRPLAEAAPERFLPHLAVSLSNLAIRLGENGNRAAALPFAQEAVDIRRRLAEAAPQRFLPDLAGSLNNLAITLGESGDRAAALPVAQEAVDTYRELAEAAPERFLPDLAMSLNNLAIRLAESGNQAAALAFAQEAADTHRRLAGAAPERFLPNLAGSLNNLAIDLAKSGDVAAALHFAQEAAEIFRQLAEAAPERFGAVLEQSERLVVRLLEGDSLN